MIIIDSEPLIKNMFLKKAKKLIWTIIISALSKTVATSQM